MNEDTDTAIGRWFVHDKQEIEQNITGRSTPLAYSSRRGRTVSTIMLHHDAGATAVSTVNYLSRLWQTYRRLGRGFAASYHYIVDRKGHVYKLVPTKFKAWHAGVSRGPDGNSANSYSIGVCLANNGVGEAYPDIQVSRALGLCRLLHQAIPDIKYLTTHRLTTKRKIDPAHFDFEMFSAFLPELQPWMDRSIGRSWNG